MSQDIASGPPVLLIFGTSHVGKSTLAAEIGRSLGWTVQSTDDLGRHPGRPWPSARPQVAEFYTRLTDETIFWFLRVHHENMWPRIRHIIQDGILSGKGLVLEGSALRPEFLEEFKPSRLQMIGLFAENTFLKRRIESASHYSERDDATRMQIDRFINRSLTDNEHLVAAGQRIGLPLLDISNENDLAAWTADFLKQSIEKKP